LVIGQGPRAECPRAGGRPRGGGGHRQGASSTGVGNLAKSAGRRQKASRAGPAAATGGGLGGHQGKELKVGRAEPARPDLSGGPVRREADPQGGPCHNQAGDPVLLREGSCSAFRTSRAKVPARLEGSHLDGRVGGPSRSYSQPRLGNPSRREPAWPRQGQRTGSFPRPKRAFLAVVDVSVLLQRPVAAISWSELGFERGPGGRRGILVFFPGRQSFAFGTSFELARSLVAGFEQLGRRAAFSSASAASTGPRASRSNLSKGGGPGRLHLRVVLAGRAPLGLERLFFPRLDLVSRAARRALEAPAVS